MYNTNVLLVIFVISALLAAGCSISPEQLVTANPIVKDFLKQYPNAEVKITFFSNVESEKIIDFIKEDCGKDSLQAKNYYKVTIEDPESGLFILSWLDWDSKIIECVLKKSQIRNENTRESDKEVMPVIEPSKPTQTQPRIGEDVQEAIPTPISPTMPTQQTPDTPTESEEKQCATSCDDGNKCTFDYCNEFTQYECKHRTLEPCYNNGLCENARTSVSSETNLPIGPSCPSLGWVSAYPATLLITESQADKGYIDYINWTFVFLKIIK